MKNYMYLLTLLVIASCTQNKTAQDEAMQKVQSDDARIANYMKSVRLASFYIADPTHPSTKEDGLTVEGTTALAKKALCTPGAN
ncbi:hypothetical protein [uncultured Fibrella sp.]|uniref:hypothetical protein n=1 Tax=uncultured Fibrella sp. TaxID=1284596 RepID=UPI0035CBC7FD